MYSVSEYIEVIFDLLLKVHLNCSFFFLYLYTNEQIRLRVFLIKNRGNKDFRSELNTK
jgi:hypothetical protein